MVPAPAALTQRRPDPRRVPEALLVVACAIILPVVLYVVLRPENYGLTPNPTDPAIYSGYALNIDDLLVTLGDRHYFVTRWTAYLPARLMSAVLGPFAGRLVLRLVLATAILATMWSTGRRQFGWTRAHCLVIGVLTLTMPMFVRAFMTDYVEYAVVSLGTVLVALCIRERQSPAGAWAIGALAAAIIIANPLSVVVVILPIGAALVVGCRTLAERARLLLLAALGGGALAAFGLLWFRSRYGLENVYQPTLDWIRTYRVGAHAEWKSPRYDWLGRFTWLYAPPLVLIGGSLMLWRRSVKLRRSEIAALVICALQYMFQWLDQFVRDGPGLELSFYWSYVAPTFIVALAILVARLTPGMRETTAFAVSAAWVALLLVGVPGALRLPPGALFFVIAVLVGGMIVAASRRAPTAAVAVLVALVAWTQIGAPRYRPSTHLQSDFSPRYDALYRQAGNVSERAYEELVWVKRQLDHLPHDEDAFFVSVGWSSVILGLYVPQLSGRMINLRGNHLDPGGVEKVRRGFARYVVLLGTPEEVSEIMREIPRDLGVGRVVLDNEHTGGLGYRLVAYSVPNAGELPFEWIADALPHMPARVIGRSLSVAAGAPPGYVTFGPYVQLPSGRYELTATIASDAGEGERVGTFDASTFESGQVAQVAIPGSAGRDVEITLQFDAPSDDLTWEFRTSRESSHDLTVRSIRLTALSP